MFIKKPKKFWGILALLVLPLLVAGAGIWSLSFAESHPDRVVAAVVNNDKPVEVDGQLVPMGRQLTAELKADQDANFDWQITTKDEAAEGLASGKYLVTLVIPADFSKAATSFSGDLATQEQARVDLTMSKNTKLYEAQLAQSLATAAIDRLGGQLTETYLENIFLGFSTMGDQIGEAVDGSKKLADGAAQLDDGLQQLAAGSVELTNGANQFAGELPKYLNGVSAVVGGLNQVASAGPQLLGAIKTLSTHTGKAASDSAALAQALGGIAQDLGGGAKSLGAEAQTLGGQAAELGGIAHAVCGADPTDPLCAQLGALAQSLGNSAQAVGQQAEKLGGQAATLGRQAQKAGGVAVSAGTADGYAKALTDKKQGLPAFVGGVDTIAKEAAPLVKNAPALKDGANGLATGSASLADGLSEVAKGSPDLVSGANELADGMAQAVDELPHYSADEAKQQANLVTSPITLDASGGALLGNTTPWLFAALALWISTLSIFFFIPARARNLGGTERSITLALKSLWLPAVIGAGQGVLIASVMAVFRAVDGTALDGSFWSGAALLAFGGIAFALVNQILVALLGATGRVISLIAAALTLLTGMISNLPAAISGTSALLPSSALAAGSSGFDTGSAVLVLSLWLGAALVGLLAITAKRRSLN